MVIQDRLGSTSAPETLSSVTTAPEYGWCWHDTQDAGVPAGADHTRSIELTS